MTNGLYQLLLSFAWLDLMTGKGALLDTVSLLHKASRTETILQATPLNIQDQSH